MKGLSHILIGVALVCYIVAVFSKMTAAGLYDIDVKPIASLVFGNSCLLLALVINSFKK